MRALTLTTLLLGLPGCAIDNPRFGVNEDGVTTTADTTATTAVASTAPTGESMTGADEPTGSSPSTGDEPDTTTPGTGTSTSEPSTTQASDPVDSSSSVGSSTGIEPEEPPPVCPLMNDAFAPYLLLNDQPLAECPMAELNVVGRLTIGDSPQLSSDVECNPGSTDVYTLGTGMALLPQPPGPCLKTNLKLVDTEDGCKINVIRTYNPGNPLQVHLLAAFSVSAGDLPLLPFAENSGYCGCPDLNNNSPSCCDGLDPGELVLTPTPNADPVAQFQHKPVTAPNGQEFEFYNLQSWVGPGCVNDPGADHHIDWIAVLNP